MGHNVRTSKNKRSRSKQGKSFVAGNLLGQFQEALSADAVEALHAPETSDVGLIAGSLLDSLFDVGGCVLHADRPKGDRLGQMSPPLPVVVLEIEDGVDHPFSSLSEPIAFFGVDEMFDAARGHVLW